ncbi:hypothetical protein [Rubinisphaera sp.]|uniref:hypothetical protein n=1 Tax=Rubinisphaera sp. TaxID=2024857 RepID=UPI000C0F9009|nr:hypothetical protein [Rubinisphaera sp.]MBV09870.1 hypothetical protein [Rubinisphaera sp.]HCS51100.1 hypothetical protein [Planctomycetaceae bacterium]|tara:strand:+ start:1671 stop:2048 length:378 start_codon:yes stop_codon:yes gene_type:complete
MSVELPEKARPIYRTIFIGSLLVFLVVVAKAFVVNQLKLDQLFIPILVFAGSVVLRKIIAIRWDRLTKKSMPGLWMIRTIFGKQVSQTIRGRQEMLAYMMYYTLLFLEPLILVFVSAMLFSETGL